MVARRAFSGGAWLDPLPLGTIGAWTNVTPGGVNLTPGAFSNDNFGVQDIVADPARPQDLYCFICHQGVWKSTDYGMTWTGPINTGTGAILVTQAKPWCAAIELSPSRNPSTAPKLWTASGGSNEGCLRSTDGGVSWTAYAIGNTDAAEQNDVYSYDIDPYDPDHLICGMHGYGISESTNGGLTWSTKNFNTSTMGGSCYPFFVDTGVDSTTRGNWVSVSDSPDTGSWHTSNSGTSWTKRGDWCHDHGNSQACVLGGNLAYFPGGGGGTGGVYRTTNGGTSWTQVHDTGANGIVATPSNLYMTYAAANADGIGDNNFRIASKAADTVWTSQSVPGGMTNGWKRCAVTVQSGHRVLVAGCWNAGIWRYVE